MTVHELKCWPEFFVAIVSGEKTFEVRSSKDRKFFPGDVLLLYEWERLTQAYTGRKVRRVVTCVEHLAPIGIPDFVLMGIEP